MVLDIGNASLNEERYRFCFLQPLLSSAGLWISRVPLAPSDDEVLSLLVATSTEGLLKNIKHHRTTSHWSDI